MKALLAFFALIFSQHLYAQDLRGLWQGYITSEDAPTYTGYLISIENQNSDYFSGRSYIYWNGIMDGHLDFIGTLRDSVLKLTELRIIKYRTPPTWYVCIKSFRLFLMRTGNADRISGTWQGSMYDGTKCSPGDVVLRRYNPDKPNGLALVPASVMLEVKKNAGKPMRFLNTELEKPVIIPVQNHILQFELSDNMQEDDDTVSVYHNRKLLINKVRVAKKTKSFTVQLERISELHEFILYANNLGKIPPNTSLLTIIDGEKKHSIMIESTKQKSAVIYLRYLPNNQNNKDHPAKNP